MPITKVRFVDVTSKLEPEVCVDKEAFRIGASYKTKYWIDA